MHAGGVKVKHNFTSARAIATSPIYTTLLTQGGVFEQHKGFERPVWFDNRSQPGDDVTSRYLDAESIEEMQG